MVNRLLQKIYDSTISIIKKEFDQEEFKYDKNYIDYLNNKYFRLLSEFIAEQSEEMVCAIVDIYIEDEKRIWQDLTKMEKISILETDSAFDYLKFLSSVAFQEAKKCVKSGVYIQDEEAYKSKLKELADCLDSIKDFNIQAAQELLSEAILDVEYVHKKSEMKSLRLSRYY